MGMMSGDFCVIGGGIAGLSVAAELADKHRVVLLERESQLAYHATGRSAALFDETYGNPTIRALTRGSRSFYVTPPVGFSDVPLVHERGTLTIATEAQSDLLREQYAAIQAVGGQVVFDSADAARARLPVLAPLVTCAIYQPDSRDIDVGAVVAAFRRLLRARGGSVLTGSEVTELTRSHDLWKVVAGEHEVRARTVINAAGAWGDEIARLASVAPIGLEPRRRTAAIADLPSGLDARRWPFVTDAEERFYFRPDAGRLLLSLSEEAPSVPCDAQPEDLDVAEAVDRVERATTLVFGRVSSQWAGLRTFVRDRVPVVGFDPSVAGFFWLVGQGGYGLQTAPALARCAAALASGRELPPEIAAGGVTVHALGPGRLRPETRPSV